MSAASTSSMPARSRAVLGALLTRCTFPPSGTAVQCALSGGPDSTALIALAVAAGLDVEAVHVDHGLRDGSSDDAALAAAAAQQFGVPFRCERVEIGNGSNLEARARHARRAAIGPGALTGHTADDQAETLLLQLLRGAGPAGLGAMRPGPTKPILGLRRAETHQLCTLLDVEVAIDPTNSDPRFRRNRVRHELLPLLDDVADRDVVPLLTRTSRLLRDDEALLAELSTAIDPTDAHAVADAAPPLATRALRRWVIDTIGDAVSNESVPSERHPPDLATIERILAVARGDAAGCDVHDGWRVERSQQRLRLYSTRATNS